MQPVSLDPIRLALDESPVDHPSADIGHYPPDLALLNYLLQDLRALLRRAAANELVLSPYQEITWFVHDLKRRTVICDPPALLVPGDVLVVGFFGDRRSSDEAARVDEVELDVIAQFREYPGILSYSSVELVDNQWANLVVHTNPTDRRQWRHGETHVRAAEELAPLVYHSVRIHNGRIPSGPIGSDTVAIETTKYFDYDCDPMWHAERILPGGVGETIGSPWPRRP